MRGSVRSWRSFGPVGVRRPHAPFPIRHRNPTRLARRVHRRTSPFERSIRPASGPRSSGKATLSRNRKPPELTDEPPWSVCTSLSHRRSSAKSTPDSYARRPASRGANELLRSSARASEERRTVSVARLPRSGPGGPSRGRPLGREAASVIEIDNRHSRDSAPHPRRGSRIDVPRDEPPRSVATLTSNFHDAMNRRVSSDFDIQEGKRDASKG